MVLGDSDSKPYLKVNSIISEQTQHQSHQYFGYCHLLDTRLKLISSLYFANNQG